MGSKQKDAGGVSSQVMGNTGKFVIPPVLHAHKCLTPASQQVCGWYTVWREKVSTTVNQPERTWFDLAALKYTEEVFKETKI